MVKGKLTLQAINQRLKAASIGVAVRQKGSALYLRATLPPKPGETAWKRRDIALKIYANPAGLERAEAEARKLGALLACKEFDWDLYLNVEPAKAEAVKVAHWIDRFKAHYFAARGHNPETEARWNKDYYSFVFKHLPPNADLNADLLVVAAQRSKANTRGRQYTCQILQQLANFAHIDLDLKPFAGNYSPLKVQPRNIPDDETIASVRDAIANPAWQWVYGLMACYGLRNHEVFFAEIFRDPPYLVTVTEGKTGRRDVRPLYPEWVERWQLWDIKRPSVNGTHRDLGDRVIKAFKRQGVPFSPYNLRHAYAIRASVVFKFPVAVAAAMMGHSPDVHWRTYNRWINQEQHQRIYDELVYQENRPQAP